MAELLSPSMTNSEKPASTTNSIAFLHASNLASSLQNTLGPLATITSPFSFRITAPYLDLLRLENTTASKLSLKTDCGGGSQVSQVGYITCSVPICSCAVQYSSNISLAWLINHPGSWNLPPSIPLSESYQPNPRPPSAKFSSYQTTHP